MGRSIPDREFARFVEQQAGGLLRHAYAMTGDAQEAQDLTQETFERAWRAWERVSRLDNPGAWARRVLANLAVSSWRRRRTRQRHLGKGAAETAAAPGVGHLDVAAALRSLPRKHRNALVMQSVLGMSTSEIAEELGTTEATVRSWVSRGRSELAARLDLERAGPERMGGDVVGAIGEDLTPAERQVEALLAEMCRAADSIEWTFSAEHRLTRGRWRLGRSARRGVVVVLVAAAVVVLLLGPLPRLHLFRSGAPRPAPTGRRRASPPRLVIPIARGEGVEFLASAGSTLYVATDYSGDPPYALSAYYASTGRLIRRVAVPSMPAALAVGPAGAVWLTFYPDQNPGPSATWLLSPNLTEHSSTSLTAPTAIIPTGADTAEIVTQDGLALLRMPPPGVNGHASLGLEPHSSIGEPANTAPDVGVAFDGHVVVQVTNGYGFESHLVEAGTPARTFGGGSRQQAGHPAVADGTLWLPTLASGAQAGPLVELDTGLQAITPAWANADPLLRSTEGIWAAGHTLLVATTVPGHGLVCFDADQARPSVATVASSGDPAALVVSGDIAYVTDGLSVADATSDVVAYSIPTACR